MKRQMKKTGNPNEEISAAAEGIALPDKDNLHVTVLGCGTSSGVPTIGCDCAVCRSTDPHNRRLRSSLYLQKNNSHLLIDCGPDFREQALRERIRQVDALFITHTHADHINGIDDLRAINWIQNSSIQVFSSKEILAKLSRIYGYCFNPPQMGGGVPKLEFHPIEPGETASFHGVRVTAIPVMHGKIPILGYRFDDFVYLTDVSSIPESSYPFIQGAHTLVLSALRHRPHETHFSVSEAIAEAARLAPRRTYFVHMTHDLDYEETNQSLPKNVQLLHDGLQFDVPCCNSCPN